jgi:hypothetical protein
MTPIPEATYEDTTLAGHELDLEMSLLKRIDSLMSRARANPTRSRPSPPPARESSRQSDSSRSGAQFDQVEAERTEQAI